MATDIQVRPDADSTIDWFKSFYLRHCFTLGPIGLLTNPFYIARSGLYRAVKSLVPLVKGRVLDVGCGHKPYLHLFRCSEYVGLEIERSTGTGTADVYYDGKTFPFDDSSFDTVITNQV